MAAAGSEERRVDASGADVDLYGVLGLNKECSDADLRLAYRRLAMVSPLLLSSRLLACRLSEERG
jgi:hypothetical protein